MDIPFISISQESGMLSGGRGRGRKKIEMGAASRGSYAVQRAESQPSECDV